MAERIQRNMVTVDHMEADDALDFIGWYNHQSFTRLKIPRNDTFKLYLAYHEGHAGYARQSYRGQQWLLDVAARVESRAILYDQQLRSCGRR